MHFSEPLFISYWYLDRNSCIKSMRDNNPTKVERRRCPECSSPLQMHIPVECIKCRNLCENAIVCCPRDKLGLRPENSFGELYKIFLNLQKVQYTTVKHHQFYW